MPTKLQIRRGTTAENAALTGAAGELVMDTDLNTVIVHDGTTQGGHSLAGATYTPVLTTKGDLETHNGTSVTRLPVGTNGQVLEADSNAATGVKWSSASASSSPTVVRKDTSSNNSYKQVPDNIVRFSGNSTRSETDTMVFVPSLFLFPTTMSALGVDVDAVGMGRR